ncbi:hypothetical protein LV85_03621 [Algoriphagus chordae]|uniref:Uncharacterized protein n=2 Tax=Algoriphagus chordae TaxID=237019 RepID=A0A2W7QKB8_9BACT|nr:hypothetical protein LV85_03621 [Algoriphagus chordae]
MGLKREILGHRIFFLAIATFFLLSNMIGFGFSINSRIHTEGSLHTHIYIHGLCAGLWILLYFIQTVLVFSKRLKLHKELGLLGIVILISVLISGFYVAFMVPVIYQSDLGQAGRDFSTILLGVILSVIGLNYRRKPFIHKRLMMVATLIFSSAGIARMMDFIGLLNLFGPIGVVMALLIPVIALMVYDYFSYKKIFKVDLMSFLSICLIFVLATPPLWENHFLASILETIVGWLS